MKHRTSVFRRILPLFVGILLIAGGVTVFAANRGEEGLLVDVFSLLATLVGTVFIAVELKSNRVVTCCDMLINLNNYFHENTSTMAVYEALERDAAGRKDDAAVWQDVREADVAAYCTFFENIYLLVHNRIARMEDIDALFGYRFFLFVNNPYIQERYILPTASSYTEIFELYAIWAGYRRKKGNGITTAGAETGFSEAYLRDEMYLHDLGFAREPLGTVARGNRIFTLRRANVADLADIMALQTEATEGLGREIYAPLTRAECMESLALDRIIMAEEAGRPVAFAVFVAPRRGARNLATHAKRALPAARGVVTFDAVAVAPAARGCGLQRALLAEAENYALSVGAGTVAASVSPENTASVRNFEGAGYRKVVAGVPLYGGFARDLYAKNVPSVAEEAPEA